MDTTRPSWEVREPTSHILEPGHVKEAGHKACSIPTILEADQRFIMRDGIRIVADIFRPKDAAGPVPAIVNWSPYGKSGSSHHNLYMMPYRCGVPLSSLSGYESWEGYVSFTERTHGGSTDEALILASTHSNGSAADTPSSTPMREVPGTLRGTLVTLVQAKGAMGMI